MMNEFFQSVLSGECVSILQQNTPRSIHTLPDFQVSTTEVYDLLCNIDSLAKHVVQTTSLKEYSKRSPPKSVHS